MINWTREKGAEKEENLKAPFYKKKKRIAGPPFCFSMGGGEGGGVGLSGIGISQAALIGVPSPLLTARKGKGKSILGG